MTRTPAEAIHEHHWRKTGEYFATNPPIYVYVYVCDECWTVGEAQDGEAITIRGVWSDEEYQKFGWRSAAEGQR